MDEADGLGALHVVSDSELLRFVLFGLEVFGGLLAGVVFVDDAVDLVASPLPVSALAVDVVVVVVLDEVVVVACVTGAGDGELLCICGDELFEPRSTDCPPRFELRNTLCCFCSSCMAAVVFLSSATPPFVESDGLVQRDEMLSLSAESLLFDDDATT